MAIVSREGSCCLLRRLSSVAVASVRLKTTELAGEKMQRVLAYIERIF